MLSIARIHTALTPAPYTSTIPYTTDDELNNNSMIGSALVGDVKSTKKQSTQITVGHGKALDNETLLVVLNTVLRNHRTVTTSAQQTGCQSNSQTNNRNQCNASSTATTSPQTPMQPKSK